MPFLTEQLSLLGLNDREVRVFTALSTFGRMNITKAAGRSGLPRTTVDYIIRGLVRRGIVTREKVAGHFEYALVLADVADQLDTLEQRLRPTSEARVTGETIVTRDKDTNGLVERAFASHEGDRVVLFLASDVAVNDRAVALEHYLRYARSSTVKLDLLTGADVFKTVSTYAKDLLCLHPSRSLQVFLLPPSYSIQAVDLIAFRDEVLAVQHKAELLERIPAGLATEAMKHLLHVMREIGWRADVRTFLGE